MRKQLEKLIGQPVTLYTEKGCVVGILESVTDKGVNLKPLPKKDRNGVDAELVLFGFGGYPWGGLRGFGLGLGGGFGGGYGFGGGFGGGYGFGGGFGGGYGIGGGFGGGYGGGFGGYRGYRGFRGF